MIPQEWFIFSQLCMNPNYKISGFYFSSTCVFVVPSYAIWYIIKRKSFNLNRMKGIRNVKSLCHVQLKSILAELKKQFWLNWKSNTNKEFFLELLFQPTFFYSQSHVLIFFPILLLNFIKGFKVYFMELNWRECFKIVRSNKYVYATYLLERVWMQKTNKCEYYFMVWNEINKMDMNW